MSSCSTRRVIGYWLKQNSIRPGIRSFHSSTLRPLKHSKDVDISKLDIDRTSRLQGTVAAHDQHVVFATGDREWPSKIDLMAEYVDGVRDPNVQLMLRTKQRFRGVDGLAKV